MADVRTDGLVNLRDLGGLPLEQGGTTRAGVLYRSDAPYPGDEVPRHVSAWPPATVVDLRTAKEVVRGGYQWHGSTRVLHHPLHEAAVPGQVRDGGDLGELYTFILDTVPERVARLVSVVAGAPDGAVLVHCAAGKDRTGIAVAALLLAAGVPPEAVVADYVATQANMEALLRRWSEREVYDGRPLPQGWLQAPEEAITLVVDRFVGWSGGVAGWLQAHGASPADLARWRRRMAG